MKTKVPTLFADLPTSYEALCRLHLPRPIHDEVGFRNTLEITEAFAGFEALMNSDQTDYFDLLCRLIVEYEAVQVPKISGSAMIRHLLDEHGLSGSDLSRILGAHRTLGPMILRGERAITADHARKLGSHFGVGAGVFIE